MKLDDVRIGVRPGNGIVARVPDAILVIPFDDSVDQAAVDRLLAECRKGRIVHRLGELRAVAGTGVPAFAIVAEVGDTLGVFAGGDASVPLVGGQPVVRLSGRGAGGWTLLVPHGFGSLEVGALDDTPADPRLDLKAGVVPGRGVIVLPNDVDESAPDEVEAEDDDDEDEQPDEEDEDDEDDEDEDLWSADEEDDGEPVVVAAPATAVAATVPAPASEPEPEPQREPEPAPEPVPAAKPMPAPAKVSRRRREQAATAPEPEPVVARAVPMAEPSPVSIPATLTPSVPEIWGIRCKKGHFNDPAARYCAICGIHIVQDKAPRVRGPRPVLGFLVLDDGTSYKLDSNYILGSDPFGHEDVVSGNARPLVVKGDGDVVSPVHARVDLQDWDVYVSDTGSVYGTYVWSPGNTDWRRLTPADEVKLGAGSQVMIAQRGFTFQPANKR